MAHRTARLTVFGRQPLVTRILRERVDRRWGPHRLGPLTGHPRSTVYAVLSRTGFSRLRDADRASGGPSATSTITRARSSTRTTTSSDGSPTGAATGCCSPSGRSQLDAFVRRGHDPNGPWSRLVQGTRYVTAHHFELLTRRR
jgi:hypothetical protein